jgi:hypothetical protein
MLELNAPMLQRLYGDWEARRRGREFPARADFDPCDFGYALGYLSLIDVFQNPLRFRFRLQGTGIVDRVGRDCTGNFIDEMKDRRHSAMATEHFSEVLKTRRPVLKARRAYVTDVRVWNCEILVVPLSNNGADIDMIMSCIAWDEVSPAYAEHASVEARS